METNGEESEIDTERREEDDRDECGLRVQWRVRESDGRGVVDGGRSTEVAEGEDDIVSQKRKLEWHVCNFEIRLRV